MSARKCPEPIEKGSLRARHGLFTFKDGTVRYDMINITLTHFKPREAHVSLEKLRELGYAEDVHGRPLERDDQVVELKVQDIIVSTGCLDYMLRASQYVDELLVRFYGYKPYYNCKTRDDLLGHLFVALAPHTSGGVLCRIVGHTKAQGHYGHPYFHASKRRNCFRGDTEVLVYREGRARKARLDELVAPAIARRGRPLDGHGTLACEPDERLEVLSLDPDSLAPRRLRVSKLVQGVTSEWVEIESSTHRTLRVTPDHRVLVQRGGRLVDVAAGEVQVGDAIPVASSLPRDAPPARFEVGALLAGLPEAAHLRIRGADAFLRERVEGLGRAAVGAAAGATAV
ncbi:MAG TPA: hypothetical protein VHH36_09045, partial [Candidatus Thermoplasmatota archaeon]|nr:hypothetical protein [Candidatus Thermoplasmatota archaeon]